MSANDDYSITYFANGQKIYESDAANDTYKTYDYNSLQKESKKGSDIYTYSKCQYLLNGQVQRVTMPYDGDNINEYKTKSYQYDSLGRLKSEGIVEAAGLPLDNTYTYDSYNPKFCRRGSDTLQRC